MRDSMHDSLRLAMSILVRDEADIIEANIRHHAALGVGKFIVTDNSSIDGTREILDRLSDEFDLQIIDEPSLTIDQDLWVSRMANRLQQAGNTDWVINNDADEFWLPVNHALLTDAILNDLDLATQSAEKIGVLYCHRYNLIPSLECVVKPGYSFAQNRYKVVGDWVDAIDALRLNYDTAAVLQQGQHVIIRTLPGKVITRLDGLHSVAMGNHDAEHQLDQVNSQCVEIAHYPIRDYQQFERKVANYGSSIENNERFGAAISLHLRRWYDSHKAAQLRREYEAIVLPEELLSKLVRQQVLEPVTESCVVSAG